MNNKTTFGRICFILFAFGAVALVTLLGSPTIAAMRAVDIVHIAGAGMCFGAALVALFAYLRATP